MRPRRSVTERPEATGNRYIKQKPPGPLRSAREVKVTYIARRKYTPL